MLGIFSRKRLSLLYNAKARADSHMLVSQGVEALTTKQKERPRLHAGASPLLSCGISIFDFRDTGKF